MPYRIHNVPLWLGEPESLLRRRTAETLGVRPDDLADVRVVRSVLDARKKGSPRTIHTVEVSFVEGRAPAKLPPGVTETEPAPPPAPRVRAPARRPIIVGTGPAGLFCALGLLERGVPSVLLERGREVVQR
ncbi:MAG TPA: FAD-dependent monooxygenase, partial [Myxococcaceae bacterium]|nr:FAD-dependent monooxygenase [Myxococcaceae bacterium]